MADFSKANDGRRPLEGIESINEFAKVEAEEFPVMDFGGALICLKIRRKVSRRGWNGAGQFLEMQVPDAHSKMTLPYIFIHTVQGDRVPWLASQTDLLSSDWYLVD